MGIPSWRRRIRLLALFAFAATLLALPAGASGHAALESVVPADGSTVAIAPTEVVTTFSEDLDPTKSSIVLAEAGGSTVLSGGEVSSTDPKRMTLAISELAAGAYEIRWTSASAVDGDLERGTTHFTYAPPNPTENDVFPTSPPPSPRATVLPSPSSTVAPSPSPSPAGTPAASTSDVLIPIVVAVVVVAALGAWLMRGRSRGGGSA